jgi:hypothetical protein
MNVRLALCAAALAALLSAPSFGAKKKPDPPVCVKSPEQLMAVDLSTLFIKHKGKIDLEPEDGCMVVGDPPAMLAAVRLTLPSFEGSYAVKVAAPVGRSMVLPRVVLLDDQFRTTRSFGAETLKRRGMEMSVEVFVDAPNVDEKFMVIYADPAHIGDTDKRTESQTNTLFVGTGYINYGSEIGSDVTAEETGDIVVSLIGERFEKAQHGK